MAFKVELKCPKHPRFNPVQGEQAVVGGCLGCYRLISLHRWLQREKETLYKWKGVRVQDEMEEIQRRLHQLKGRIGVMEGQLERDEDLDERDLMVLGAVSD